MVSITKFEDLIAWQEARILVKSVYKITSDGIFAKDFGMRDQIQRASVSVMTYSPYAVRSAGWDTCPKHLTQRREGPKGNKTSRLCGLALKFSAKSSSVRKVSD
ncbi:MAG: four helix bundle protein [Chloroflexota bacterium]